METKKTTAKQMALGGMLAALAVVIMSMGTLIPVATYACPCIAILTLQIVLRSCGRRIAWAWYGAVALLCLLLAPDKEAAAVFVFFGYYPIIKPALDRAKGAKLWKGLYFNLSVLGMYVLLLYVLGMEQLLTEFREMGLVLGAVTLALGNAVFFMLDRLLSGKVRRRFRGGWAGGK